MYVKRSLVISVVGTATAVETQFPLFDNIKSSIYGLMQSSSSDMCFNAMKAVEQQNADYSQVIGSGTPWTDSYFDPEDGTKNVFYWEGLDSAISTTGIWKRPQEFVGTNEYYDLYTNDNMVHEVSLWGSSINVHDIAQGSIGDCYFLAALAALSEHPEVMRKIIPIDQLSAEGIVPVNYFI
jgi:hypothetical protein